MARYDEGTAYMPVVSKKRQLPVHEKYNFMALDEDGFDLPSDWYMRIAGFIAEGLRGDRIVHETFPSKELEDYWSTRPRYEDTPDPYASGKKNQSWEDWQKLAGEKGAADEPPPPPYSLEAGEPSIPPAEAGPSGSGPPLVAPRPEDPTQSTSPPPVGPRPEVVAAAVGVAGALNAPPGRSPEQPLVPLASRPSISRPPIAGPSGSGPPPIPARSRPQPPPIAPRPSTDASGLADDLSRTHISAPTSPRTDAPQQYPARPISPPSNRPPSTCANAPFPGYTPTSFQSSHNAPPGEPQRQDSASSTFFPEPSTSAPSVHPPSPTAGPWAQTTWPPPEWGAPVPAPAPPSPTLAVPYTPYQPHRHRPHSPPPPSPRPHQPQGPGHTSSYGPAYAPPRPSSAYGAPEPEPGFAFPQAQMSSFPTGEPYGAPQPQPYGAPPAPYGQQQWAYGPYGAGAGTPPPGAQPYGAFCLVLFCVC